MELSTAQAMLWSAGIAGGTAVGSIFVTYLVTSRSVDAQGVENRNQRRVEALEASLLPARGALARLVHLRQYFLDMLTSFAVLGLGKSFGEDFRKAADDLATAEREVGWTRAQLVDPALRQYAARVVEIHRDDTQDFVRVWGDWMLAGAPLTDEARAGLKEWIGPKQRTATRMEEIVVDFSRRVNGLLTGDER